MEAARTKRNKKGGSVGNSPFLIRVKTRAGQPQTSPFSLSLSLSLSFDLCLCAGYDVFGPSLTLPRAHCTKQNRGFTRSGFPVRFFILLFPYDKTKKRKTVHAAELACRSTVSARANEAQLQQWRPWLKRSAPKFQGCFIQRMASDRFPRKKNNKQRKTRCRDEPDFKAPPCYKRSSRKWYLSTVDTF